jgi:hypothetical protein
MLEALSLSFFKETAVKIVQHTKVDLSKYPFCIEKKSFKFTTLKHIQANSTLSTIDKTRRITSFLIDLAYEHLTTRSTDIGTLVETHRPIYKEYAYYKQAFQHLRNR